MSFSFYLRKYVRGRILKVVNILINIYFLGVVEVIGYLGVGVS